MSSPLMPDPRELLQVLRNSQLALATHEGPQVLVSQRDLARQVRAWEEFVVRCWARAAAESDARAYGPGLREPDEDALRQLAELLGTDPLPSSLRLFREEYLSTAGDQVALQVSP